MPWINQCSILKDRLISQLKAFLAQLVARHEMRSEMASGASSPSILGACLCRQLQVQGWNGNSRGIASRPQISCRAARSFHRLRPLVIVTQKTRSLVRQRVPRPQSPSRVIASYSCRIRSATCRPRLNSFPHLTRTYHCVELQIVATSVRRRSITTSCCSKS